MHESTATKRTLKLKTAPITVKTTKTISILQQHNLHTTTTASDLGHCRTRKVSVNHTKLLQVMMMIRMMIRMMMMMIMMMMMMMMMVMMMMMMVMRMIVETTMKLLLSIWVSLWQVSKRPDLGVRHKQPAHF